MLAAFLVVAGSNHFISPEIYGAMMPPWLPVPAWLHQVVGAAEIAGGLGLLLPRFRRAAGWGLIALLVAIFPANLHAAFTGEMPGFDAPAWVLWARLPFQAVFVAWVWWTAKPGPGGGDGVRTGCR